MGWTKQDLAKEAFKRLGYGNTFDLAPDQLEGAVTVMDAMIASWAAEGIRIGYNLASSPSATKSTEDSGLIDAANEAVYMNLAKRLSGSFGKALTPVDLDIAKTSYNALLNKVASNSVRQMQWPRGLPRGSGNKPWRNTTPFVDPPQDTLNVGPDSELTLG